MSAGNPEKACGEVKVTKLETNGEQNLANLSIWRSHDITSEYLLGASPDSCLTKSRENCRNRLKPELTMTRRAEFQKNILVGKKDFTAIEYLLRKGHRQLEMYSSPGIRNIR